MFSTMNYLSRQILAPVLYIIPVIPENKTNLDVLQEAYGQEQGSEINKQITSNPKDFILDERPLVRNIALDLCESINSSKKTVGPVACALADIYDSVDGFQWVRQSPGWVLTERHCPLESWTGISTIPNPNPLQPRIITSVKLIGNGLNGQLSSVLSPLGKLDVKDKNKLSEINVSSNQLKGPLLDRDIAQLPSMVIFCAAFNEITGTLNGEILGEYWKRLVVLSLQSNQLTGSIPSFSSSCCPNLRILHLYSNNFENEIPNTLGELSNLEEIRFWSNHLTGHLPKSLCKLKKLKVLHLAGNNLTGNIPNEIDEMDSLEYLYLHDNEMSGNIPINSLIKLSKLKTCALRNNKFNQFEEFEIKMSEINSSISFSSSEVDETISSGVFELENEEFRGASLARVSNPIL